MTFIPRKTYCATMVGMLIALGVGNHVFAEDTEVLNEVVDLNKEALVAFQERDMEHAMMTLKKALELCTMEGIEGHTITARTHIHLGVVYLMGFKQRDQALAEFRHAIGIDPNIKMTRTLNSPEVEAVFNEANEKGGTTLPSTPSPRPPLQAPPPQRASSAPRSDGANGVIHTPVSQAKRNKDIEIKAQIAANLGAEKIILAYRSEGSGHFQTLEMLPIEDASSWYQATIPSEATSGAQASYYIEALNEEGQRLATNGTASSPHRIQLNEREGSPQSKNSNGSEDSTETPLLFILAVGAGGGTFSSSPEMNPRNGNKTLKASGLGLATLAHLAPEIGYFWSEDIVVSVRGRLQYVTGSQDVRKDGKIYQTTHMAIAGLAKVAWVLAPPSDTFQPFIAAEGGLGEIRYPVKTEPLEGCGANGGVGPCKDTVRGGLGLLGGSLGFIYMLGESLGFYSALNVLGSAPSLSLTLDLNLGIAIFR
jgi:hypothetical protein